MNELELDLIQSKINYSFKNPNLLIQAFTRSSYAQEHHLPHNEVLEFIGDTALDMIIVKMSVEKFGHLQENSFECDKSEGQLTELKSSLVDKKSLASCIDKLGLIKYLKIGTRDFNNNVKNSLNAKEDLFEAIVGAVTLDSNWDYDKIYEVVEYMLEPFDKMSKEIKKNYIGLVQTWSQRRDGQLPIMKYHQYSTKVSNKDLIFECEITLPAISKTLKGYGKTKKDAKEIANKMAYKYLEDNNLIKNTQNIIEKVEQLDSVSKLEVLASKGYVSLPKYDYEQSYDSNGNPRFFCVCTIKEFGWFYSKEYSTKKDAKKDAAEKAMNHFQQHKQLGVSVCGD